MCEWWQWKLQVAKISIYNTDSSKSTHLDIPCVEWKNIVIVFWTTPSQCKTLVAVIKNGARLGLLWRSGSFHYFLWRETAEERRNYHRKQSDRGTIMLHMSATDKNGSTHKRMWWMRKRQSKCWQSIYGSQNFLLCRNHPMSKSVTSLIVSNQLSTCKAAQLLVRTTSLFVHCH